ncbi:hypothetical protein [Streptomyces sp. NPDC085540]|uniref:hypothetical protein n=1 Tax=Streptomyces sp. NPDC085540 TaxID=3365730 RepID=UPI0037D59A6C
MVADQQALEIGRLLEGAEVRSVGRAADMGVVELASAHGDIVMAHVQCPFRILHEGKALLGSRDMRYPQQGAADDAFDRFRTVYDARAATLNGILGQLRPRVREVTFGEAGSLTVNWEPGFRLQLFPDCSGSMEAWRVFIRNGQHYGYPESSV